MVLYSFVRTNEGYIGSISDYSQSFLSMLGETKKDRKYITFSVLRIVKNLMLSNINMTVSLEDYEIDEDAEKSLTIYVNIKLKQYMGYSTDFLIGSIYDDGALAVTSQQQTRDGTKQIPSEYGTVWRYFKLYNCEILWKTIGWTNAVIHKQDMYHKRYTRSRLYYGRTEDKANKSVKREYKQGSDLMIRAFYHM